MATPRTLIKRYLPDHQKVRGLRTVQFFDSHLHDPNLWHLTRRSVAGAFAVGVFCALLPIPFQMVLAALLALLVRVNLPLSVALVWITNPLTMAPILYLNYQFGNWLLGLAGMQQEIAWSAEQWLSQLAEIWKPLMLGSLALGTLLAGAGFVLVHWVWRYLVLRHRRRRQRR